MTFTATGEPSNTPPRVLLEVGTGESGATFNRLSVSRDGVQVRLQPPVGVEDTQTYDYEMPFGQLVQYVASGDYLPFVAPDWTESWPNLSSWTGGTASWSVAAGVASSTIFEAAITRSTSGTVQRASVTNPANVVVRLLTSSDEVVAEVTSQSGSTTLVTASDGVVTPNGGSYSVTLLDGVVSVTAADSSWSLEASYTGLPVKVRLVSLGGEFTETGTPFSSVGNADRVVVAASGNIYTLDVTAKLVRKFNSAGVSQTSWSTTNKPSDIAVDSSENVYVTDRISKLVRKYSSTGTPGTTWSTSGTPTGIGIDNSNNVYVYDFDNDRIRKYTATGTVVTSWSNDGETANFEFGKALDVLPGGSTVYTIVSSEDAGTDETTINRFSSTGTLLGSHTFAEESPDASINVTTSGDYWVSGDHLHVDNVLHSVASGNVIGAVNISPHINGGLFPSGTSLLLMADKTSKTIRYFAPNTASIGTISATPSVGAVTFYETASVTLNVNGAWLIHPAQPTLSVSIDAGPDQWRANGLNVDIASSQQTNAGAAVSLHQPIGRTRTVTIAHGNRLDEQWQLVLLAPTLADRDDVRAIVRDQTPLLLRSPEAFGWDLTDGYYAIGDVAFDRAFAPLNYTERRIVLPLTPSDPPVVRVASERTYDDVLQQNDTYGTLLLRYDTYSDLLLGID